MRVADYIAQHLKKVGVDQVFLVSGGMMMHLLDGLARTDGIDYTCCHHEQACSIAAEGYARKREGLGVCYATSGPAATNILTGMLGAWQDSAPVLYITGQSSVGQTIDSTGIQGLRQFGTFEVDIVPMTKHITKYAVVLDDPSRARYELEKAITIALSGRPGPVHIDLPLNVQGAQIDPESLEGFTDDLPIDPTISSDRALDVLAKIQSAKRPVLLAGYGIRCAQAVKEFQLLVNHLEIPVITTQLGKDILTHDHPQFVGHCGIKGDRAANFAVQNADLILSIGCSLHIQTTGYDLPAFAPHAHKIQVDMDQAILERSDVGVDEQIVSEAKTFIETLDRVIPSTWNSSTFADWNTQCREWRAQYSTDQEDHKHDGDRVNYYAFKNVLTACSGSEDTIVTDAGSAYYILGQAYNVKDNQRFITSGALGAMGYALPSSLGVARADPLHNTICVTGDGSLMMNLQELATVAHNHLNIKLFVIVNGGYASIRNTQDLYCDGLHAGTDCESGLVVPPIKQLAEAFDLPYVGCTAQSNLESSVVETLQSEGPVICEIPGRFDQQIIPTVSSVKLEDGSMRSTPLHDMFPFLPEESIRNNLYWEDPSMILKHDEGTPECREELPKELPKESGEAMKVVRGRRVKSCKGRREVVD